MSRTEHIDIRLRWEDNVSDSADLANEVPESVDGPAVGCDSALEDKARGSTACLLVALLGLQVIGLRATAVFGVTVPSGAVAR